MKLKKLVTGVMAVVLAVTGAFTMMSASAYTYGDIKPADLGKVVDEFEANKLYTVTAPADKYRYTYNFEITKETDFVLTAYAEGYSTPKMLGVTHVSFDVYSVDDAGYRVQVPGINPLKIENSPADGKEYTNGFTLAKGKYSISFRCEHKGDIAKWKLASDVEDGNFKKYEKNPANLKVYIPLKKGAKMNLAAMVDNDAKVTYSTSNKNVLTVSSKGTVTAKKAGKAAITIKAGKETVKLYFKVT